MNDSKPEYAIWFSRFRDFNTEKFGAAGIVLLNFLMYRARGKNYGEFQLTDGFILKECGIKRSQLESLTRRFESIGFLSVRTKGIQNPTYYYIDFKKLVEVVKQLVKPDAVDDIIAFFKQEAKNQAAVNSATKTASTEKYVGVSKWELSSLIELVNDTYAQRVKMFNESIEKNPQNGMRKKDVTAFHLSKAEKFNFSKLLLEVGRDRKAISSSLIVFFDEILKGTRRVNTSILSYFLVPGDQNDFPVFREYLEKYKLTYGYE